MCPCGTESLWLPEPTPHPSRPPCPETGVSSLGGLRAHILPLPPAVLSSRCVLTVSPPRCSVEGRGARIVSRPISSKGQVQDRVCTHGEEPARPLSLILWGRDHQLRLPAGLALKGWEFEGLRLSTRTNAPHTYSLKLARHASPSGRGFLARLSRPGSEDQAVPT